MNTGRQQHPPVIPATGETAALVSENPLVLSCPQATAASFVEPDVHVRLPQLACLQDPSQTSEVESACDSESLVLRNGRNDIILDSKRPDSSSWTIVAPLGRGLQSLCETWCQLDMLLQLLREA